MGWSAIEEEEEEWELINNIQNRNEIKKSTINWQQ
jgi:hypothetical protein